MSEERSADPQSDAGPASALVVAIAKYDRHPPLDRAAAAAAELAHALAKGGITHAFPSGLSGGKAHELAAQIDAWMEAAGRDDRLLLYWSGHGMKEADGFYLITQDSPLRGFKPFNAMDPRSLAKGAANSKAKKILIVLDACFSGDALGDVIGTISDVLGGQTPAAWSERAVVVLTSAHALQKAQEGVLSSILKDVLTSRRAEGRWSDNDRFIGWESLFDSIIDEIGRRGLNQIIFPVAVGKTSKLLLNPRYRPGLPAETVEERAWRLEAWAGVEHFDLSARGIEVGERGQYFAGRKALLRKLVEWLDNAQRGVRIVTGPPGAGKSAIMGRLAMLSHPQYRVDAITAGVMPLPDEGTVPSEEIIDVAIHAKGRTLDDCARTLARALKLPAGGEASVNVDALVAEIGKIDRRLTIIVDALDEAAFGQGYVMAERLIVPLGRLGRVRVLVGSRRSFDGTIVPQTEDRHGRLRAAFGADAIIDDLEDEQTTPEDIAEYVRRRLAASSRHCNNPPGIAAAAAQVVARANGIFLYARIVSRTLQDLDHLDAKLPSDALAAFANDLRVRFGAEEQRVDDLFAALAWGEGKGLTRRVWPLIANALARRSRSYGDDDVAWVLSHAGWHIIEVGEDGRAVYRLGHQALADHYRGRLEAREAQDQIVAALTSGIAGADWINCDDYVRLHVADHAAQAGCLRAMIRDPGYLAVADPARLVTVLAEVADEEERRFADVYNRVVDQLMSLAPVERLPLIHMTAQLEAPDVAPLLEPPVPTPWRCRWAQWARRSTPHRIIGRFPGQAVYGIALGEIDGRAVVASGTWGAVQLWNTLSGVPFGHPIRVYSRGDVVVALGAIDGRAVVVSGSWDGAIRLWDARSGTPAGPPLDGGARVVKAIAFGAVDGRAVIASGYDEDPTVRLWDARAGRPFLPALVGHHDAVRAVAFGAVDERTVVVSGSSDGTIRLWDARAGTPIGQPLVGHVGPVSAVAFGEVDRRTAVISGGCDGTIRLWDARVGTPVGQPLAGHQSDVNAVAFGDVEERPVIVSGGADHTVRLWDACGRTPIGLPFEGHTGEISALALGKLNGNAVVVSGSYDGTIRLWDLRTAVPTPKLVDKPTWRVKRIALGKVDDCAFVVSVNVADTVQVWDARTGTPIGHPLVGHDGAVNAVAAGAINGRAIVVSGGADSTVRVWDACSGTQIGPPLMGHRGSVNAVAVGAIDGRAFVVSGGADSTVRVWDASGGAAIRRPLVGHKSEIETVAFGVVDGRVVVVSGSRDKTIRLWDPVTRTVIGRLWNALTTKRIRFRKPFKGHANWVIAAAVGAVNRCVVVVSASPDGTLRLWEARTGKLIAGRFWVEQWVKGVALVKFNGHDVVISGGDDGTIRLWDTSSHTFLWDMRPHHEEIMVRLGSPVRSMAHHSDVGIAIGTDDGFLLLDFPKTS
jgi:WD40 repeat protein